MAVAVVPGVAIAPRPADRPPQASPPHRMAVVAPAGEMEATVMEAAAKEQIAVERALAVAGTGIVLRSMRPSPTIAARPQAFGAAVI